MLSADVVILFYSSYRFDCWLVLEDIQKWTISFKRWRIMSSLNFSLERGWIR